MQKRRIVGKSSQLLSADPYITVRAYNGLCCGKTMEMSPKDCILIDNHMVHPRHAFDYKFPPQHNPLIYKRLGSQRLNAQICRVFSLLFVSPISSPGETAFCRFDKSESAAALLAKSIFSKVFLLLLVSIPFP